MEIKEIQNKFNWVMKEIKKPIHSIDLKNIRLFSILLDSEINSGKYKRLEQVDRIKIATYRSIASMIDYLLSHNEKSFLAFKKIAGTEESDLVIMDNFCNDFSSELL
ncbi:MAG: hypothetical protein ACRC0V_06620 [Fusobacteriaceae bacterium]